MLNKYSDTDDFLKLSEVPDGEIKKKAETPEFLRKLLLPVEELELEDVSLSGSEISDAFADLHKDSFLSHAKGEKAISKHEADKLTMKQFTKVFKKTMKAVRKDLKLGDNMMLENPADIQQILDERREPEKLPQALQEHIDELLKDREYLRSTPSEVSEEATTSRKGSSMGVDAMSGVWRMLAVRDTKDRFRISSPTFNAFRQDQPHWLDRPAVSRQTIEFSKDKCEKWLNAQGGQKT